MPESLNNRIRFNKKGIQNKFILRANNILGLQWKEFARILNISPRTLADWKREVIDISEISARQISKLTNIPIPKNHTVIDWRLHFQRIGKIGAKSRFAKYGRVALDEKYRKEKWRQWWEDIGKYKKPAEGFTTLKAIKIPKKSKVLAEFIGILLGDGHISQYQIGVTLSAKEKQYIHYICGVIRKLFGVVPTIVRQKVAKAVTIVVSRKLLVNFCQEVGFEMGNKISHQVDIPEWIKENQAFTRECLRGLVDTDGCFFTHSYVISGKRYSYLKIAFTSASTPLRLSVEKILINLGYSVRMSSIRVNSNGRDVRIDDAKFVAKYIDEIGSHNQKHLDKIRKWKDATNGKSAVC